MAQPGNFTPILLYSSSTPTNVPLAANLTNSTNGAELAINIADKNLFFKDSGNVVNTVPIRQSSTSSNGWLSATDWNTFNSKAPATSGTSLLYGNGSGGFSNVTIGTGLTFVGGTLASTASGGTVTSVAATVPAFLSISGSPITTSGTLAITLSGTALPVANGGTGLTTLGTGYIPYGNGASALSSAATFTTDGNNLSIGTSLAGWTGGRAIDIGTVGAFYGDGVALDYSTGLSNNAYRNSGGNWIYKLTGIGPALLQLFNNTLIFKTAGTGTAGGAIAWTQAFTVFASGGVSIGNTTDPGAANLSVSGTIKALGYTVATLPTGVTGARAYVTNALAPTFGATVAGGGAVTIPVFYNGANWIVG